MFKLAELEVAVSSLTNQLEAGIELREAVRRMVRLQPLYADFWSTCESHIGRGHRLSDMLKDVWPQEYVLVVHAGEESGDLNALLRQLHKSILLRKQIRAAFQKLITPVITLLAGIGVFLFFMVGVIPKLQKGLGGGEQSFVFKLSSLINTLLVDNWPIALTLIVGSTAAAIAWLSNRANWEHVYRWAAQAPMLGPAFRDLTFGQWAYTVGILDASGVPAKAQLQYSVKTLPEVYQDGVRRMADEVEKRGRSDAANPDKQQEGDPRREWPFYIAAAFMTAHETGRLDREMQRVAPILVDEGIQKMGKFVALADIFTKFLAMAFVGAPMLAYFTQLSNSLTKAFQS